MRELRRWPTVLPFLPPLLAVLLLALPGGARAEVGVDDATGAFLSMALERNDNGPEGVPFPWSRVRAGGASLLNESGDDAGDGRPGIAVDRNTGRPVVAWARAEAEGPRRVVLSRWDGQRWTDPEPVSTAGIEAADAAVDVTDGGLPVVAWWEPETGTVTWVRRRLADGTWADPESIGGDGGVYRFPSVVAPEGDVVVVFSVERDDGTFAVRVARRSEGWAEHTLEEGLTNSQWRGRGDLAIEIHRQGNVVWAEWARSASEFATSRLDPATGEWSAPESIPCEPSMDGWRRARFEARRRALGH